jgi:tetratricopeptide (TPR) repeat protein
MLGLLRMVAWTMRAIAMLLLFATQNAHAQGTQAEETRDANTDRIIAQRYEKILSSRPELGSAFEKFYEIHFRQASLDELCERLAATAKSNQAGNLFQLLGLLQMRRGLSADAVASLTQAELLLPNEPLACLYRSRALTLDRQYGPAIDALRNAASRKPSQVVAIDVIKEARLLKDRGLDVENLIQLLSEFEKQFKASPEVNELLADCYLELGRPEAALPVYENQIALTRDPLRRVELRMQLARLKKRLGEPQQALSELEQLATQVRPQSWLHASLLEQIEQFTEELHGPEAVVSYYERALLERPDDLTAMLRLVKVLSKQSRTVDAQRWISKALEASPNSTEPLLAQVDLLEKTREFKLAADTMQQLAQLEPSNVDYLVRWGRMEAQAASESDSEADQVVHHANAASVWKKILLGHEADPSKAIQVAELLRSIPLSDEALEMYQQAVRASGEKGEYCELLAEYLMELERREEARNVLMSSLAAAEKDRESLLQLSEVLMRLRFQKEAIEALEMACSVRAELADLIQLSDMQRENDRIEASLETLNRATKVADSSADLTKVWEAQVKTFKRINNLPARIAEWQKTLEASGPRSVESLQQLAIMQSANNQLADAATTALQATHIAPELVPAWLLTARFQHEAGMSIQEIESLERLCKLDENYASDYLQRIATIHFQLNQLDQALVALERVFALPTATLQHFQLAASFCLQAKKVEQAIAILNRATQVFPRDRSAWLLLARQLAELKNKPASQDSAWHVLDLSRDQEQQREAISLLVAIQPQIASLLTGIKQFGIEHDKEDETALWSAWALLESSDTQPAGDIIAHLLKKTDASPEALRAAVALAVRQRDYAQAALIQRRITLENASELVTSDQLTRDQLQLGQWLWLSGEKEAAATEWKSVMRSRANEKRLTDFARDLLDKANWSLAASLVNLGIESEFMAWDFVVLGVFANIQDKNLSKAAELSEILLAVHLPADTLTKQSDPNEVETRSVPLTAVDRLTWLEHAGTWQGALNEVNAARAGYRTRQSNPRASQAAAVRYLAMQRGAALRSSSMVKYSINCFAEARALAVLTRYGKTNQQRRGSDNDFIQYVDKAIASKNVGQLWDCVLVLEPSSYRGASYTISGVIEYRDGREARLTEVLDALVALREPAAVELAISEMVARRQLHHQLADRLSQGLPMLAAEELARLESLIQKVEPASLTTKLNGQVMLAAEYLRSQRAEDAQQLLREILSEAKEISQLAICARQFLSSDPATQQVVSQLLLRAFELELESRDEGSDLAFAISAFRDLAGSKPAEFIFEMLRLQAKHTAGLSSELLFSDSRSNESRRAYRSFRKPTAITPDRSSILSTSLRAALLDSSPTELSSLVSQVTANKAYPPSELAVRYFSASIAAAILNEPDHALAALKLAKEQHIATDVISLYEVWLLVANQKLDEANHVLATITTSNESMRRESELWKMEVGLKLGNVSEAQRAARALSKLPLSVHESSDVAVVLSK